MTFTVIGYDTEAFTQIYEVVEAECAADAVEEVRETWDSETDVLIAVIKGEPENLYDTDDDPIANGHFDVDDDFEDEDEEAAHDDDD